MTPRAESAPRRPAPRRIHAGPWLTLLLAGAAARLAVAWWARPGAPLEPDPRLAQVAARLARGAGFALGASGAPTPTACIPPLPPALLAAVSRVAGPHAWLEPALACVMGALAALAAARLATVLFGITVGRVAGWCAALSPLLLRGAGLLEESLFSCALLFALVASAEWLRTPRGGRAFGAGLCWGACALCGTLGILLPPLALVWAWPPLGLELPAGERSRQAGLALLGLLCVVAPWTLRNAITLRGWAPLTTSSGIAVLASNNPVVWRDASARGGRLDVERLEPFASRLAALREPARDSLAWAEARAFVTTRPPREFARTAVARLARLWGPALREDAPARAAGRAPDTLERAAEWAEWGLLLLALWGAVRSLSGPRRWFQSLPVLVAVTATAAAALVACSSRVRLELEPLIAVLAAAGIQHARRLLRLRGRNLRVIRGRVGLPSSRPGPRSA